MEHKVYALEYRD